MNLRILDNARYSSPLNPIENIFGIWKKRAEASQYQNRRQILESITNSFKTITAAECYSTIEDINFKIQRTVMQRIDI